MKFSKKIRKRLYIGLFFILIGYALNVVKKEIKLAEVKKILDTSENDVEIIIQEYLQHLEKSHFNEEEKEILIKNFVPYLREYADIFDQEFITNILDSTEATLVYRNWDFSNSTFAAMYSNIPNFIPFGNLVANGVIFLDEDYSEEEFYHEYIHSIQSWNNEKYIYAETYSSFHSGDNYSDLQAIFTMLGDLGDKELLLTCLANGTMDKYWDNLVYLYKDEQMIKRLRKNIEKTFYYTYKSPILIPEFQNNLRRDVLDDITNLYNKKYSTNINDDLLFQILSSIYLLEKDFIMENNQLLGEYIYSYLDEDNNKVFLRVDNDNRFKRVDIFIKKR